MSKALLLNAAASGAAGGGTTFVDDVFATHLYEGASATNNIVNNIDVSGEGGLVWLKHRVLSGASATTNQHHQLYDTVRGASYTLNSNRTNAQDDTGSVMTFNNNGFTLIGSNSVSNRSGNHYVSWTFRKQRKFFDVVTYTGNGNARTISHNLGSVPGMYIVKKTSGAEDWFIYHRSTGNPNYVKLNTTEASSSAANIWNNTTPTATVFSLSGRNEINQNGETYIAYLFAHAPNSSFLDETAEYYANGSNISGFYGSGEYRIYSNSGNNTTYYNAGTASGSVGGANKFAEIEAAIETATGQKVRTGPQKGTSGNATFYSIITLGAASSPFDDEESFITCGSYTGTGSYSRPPVITLGFEPQWVMIKKTSGSADWMILDVMRGATSQIVGTAGNAQRLNANTSGAETSYSGGYIPVSPTTTGFTMSIDGQEGNGSGETYIYMAIRRPNKEASEFAANKLFSIDGAGNASGDPDWVSNGHVVDMAFFKHLTSTEGAYLTSRLNGNRYINISGTGAEASDSTLDMDFQSGVGDSSSSAVSNYQAWMFRRAPGFFDVVCYDGTGSARTITHNLGVTPEFIIAKSRTESQPWVTYDAATGATKYLRLEGTNAAATYSGIWNDTAPTSSVFSTGGDAYINKSGHSYIAFLFASTDGISKVGSYTGTGSTLNIDCGFTNGARFVLLKRTDSADDWWLYDSVRGISASNDPYLALNEGQASVTSTNYVSALSSGFTINSNAPSTINGNGGTYIFLAIA